MVMRPHGLLCLAHPGPDKAKILHACAVKAFDGFLSLLGRELHCQMTCSNVPSSPQPQRHLSEMALELVLTLAYVAGENDAPDATVGGLGPLTRSFPVSLTESIATFPPEIHIPKFVTIRVEPLYSNPIPPGLPNGVLSNTNAILNRVETPCQLQEILRFCPKGK